MDIGCGECQMAEQDFSAWLHPAEAFAVDSASNLGVMASATGTLFIAGGAEVTWRWTVPSTTKVPVGYSFAVSVTGDATLAVYLDGASESAATFTAADGEAPFGYFYTGTHTVRLAVTGAGQATVSTLKCSDFGAHNWYVNPKGNDSADGQTPETARKTLVEVMKLAASGDVVHAAPGTYAEGFSTTILENDHTTNRVLVTSGVGLVADEGPDVTFIEGAKPLSGGTTGSDAIRCVGLGLHSWLKGFTLRNGATASSGSYQDYGGGSFYSTPSSPSAAVYGCVYDNCSARRGGGGYGGIFVGCKFGANCTASSESYSLYDCYRAINCVFRSMAYGKFTLVNCSAIGCEVRGNGTQEAYNTYFGKAGNSNMTCHDCRMVGRELSVAETLDDADAPCYGSALIDVGDANHYRTNFPSAWAMFSGTAVNGVRRAYGATIDVGAGEFAFGPTQIPATSGVTVAFDGSTLTVTRNYASAKLATGFTLNGTAYAFPIDGSGDVVEVPLTGSLEDVIFTVTYVSENDRYVDQANGDDTYAGYAPAVAYKTLARALTNVTSGCTVYVAPGVYRENAMAVDTTNRFAAVVPANVKLVATGKKSACVIEGAPDPSVALDAKPYGCGFDAVRCVYLNGGAEIHGFTVRNGRGGCWNGNPPMKGAGIVGANRQTSLAVDCIVTGNAGSAGGGVYSATLIRCEVAHNSAGTEGGGANIEKCDAYCCYLHDEYTPTSAYVYGAHGSRLMACSIFPTSIGQQAGVASCETYSCYLGSERNYNMLYRTYYTGLLGTATTADGDSVGVTESTMAFDDQLVPIYGDNLGIDKGDWVACTNGAYAVVQRYLDKDFNGNPRIANGAMDIGCCELDFADVYTRKLKSGRCIYTVTSASPNVTLAANGVVLTEGTSLVGTVVTSATMKGENRVTVARAGEGTLTVTLDGVTLDGTNGVYTFTCTSETEHVLTFTFAGTGSATVTSVCGPVRGTLIIVR